MKTMHYNHMTNLKVLHYNHRPLEKNYMIIIKQLKII